MARERVLSRRELNRALLARQLLLRRVALPIPRAIERVGALQAQWPPSPYIALWSRLEDFRREQLVRALERRQVVRATLMRTTLHHVSARDYLAYAGESRSRRCLESQLAKFPGALDHDELVETIVRHASERPRSRPELFALLGGETAMAFLVRRYLAAFGPATRADAAQWTGLAVVTLEPAFELLQLRRFRDEEGRELYDLPRAPLPPASTPAPPRFLPMWDSTLLAHSDRTRILPEAYRKIVIRKSGDVRRTFLVDGFVAGLWDFDDGRVRLEPFEPLSVTKRRALEAEGKRSPSSTPRPPRARPSRLLSWNAAANGTSR